MISLKKNPNIYEEYEFTNVPYDSNEKFSVYIPKEKDTIFEKLSRSHRDFRPNPHLNQSNLSQSQSLPKYFDHSAPKDDNIHLPLISMKKEIEENIKPIKSDVLNQKEVPRRTKSLERIQKINENRQVISSPNKEKKRQIIQALKRTKDLEAFRAKLYFDDRTKTVPKSTIKSNIIENLIKERVFVMSNKELINSIIKLKTLNLLKNPCLKIEKFKGGKVSFINNDYHLRETNQGYVRNTLGTFFTR